MVRVRAAEADEPSHVFADGKRLGPVTDPVAQKLISLKPGDRVVHALRPEWGTGVVAQAQPITYEGLPAQRLVIEFVHRGRVTVNSAVAPLSALIDF